MSSANSSASLARMKANATKTRTDEVRIHSSTKTKSGKLYSQFCVRFYEDGVRKQRCFGQLQDAEKLRASILAKRLKVDRIPRGMRVIIQGLVTGQRLMIDRKGGLFIQSAGGDPKPLPFAASWAFFTDIFMNHCGHESGPGLSDYFGAVMVQLVNGEAK